MKNMKKVLALVLAAVMVMAMGMIGFAAETGSITITPPSGTDANATNTYKIYKVFDAVASEDGISYKIMASKEGQALPTGFVTDSAGNVIHGTKDPETGKVTPSTATELTEAEIASIAAYVDGDAVAATATSTGTADATATGLANGYYYITTSTGSVVTIDSTKPDAEVIDKNTVPELDKKAKQAEDPTYMEVDEKGKNAIAQVGKDVPYEATITVGKGAKNYVFHDTMSAGLTYNNDVEVTASPAITGDWYTVETTPDAGDTITITFKDGIAEGTVITIKYSGKVTSDALSVNPATNTATLTYGDENSNNKTPDNVVKVYNAQITVEKKKGNGEPLDGAGFVVKNEEGKYYKLDGNAVTWVDSINNATEHLSADGGKVPAFTGLGNGKYSLEEKTVPEGYNKAADTEFEIKGDNYTAANLQQTASVTNNAGAELPSTGGIGTTMFYIVGSALVIGAVVLLISRRRMNR